MSQETSRWLNTQTLQGFTAKRGHAWHYDESSQGSESNHYPGAIPEEDVRRRLDLFHLDAIEGTYESSWVDKDGVVHHEIDQTRKNLIHPVDHHIIAGFKNGYKMHSYGPWLIDNMKGILDDGELGIGSAGLLRKGAQAWVQVEMPESIGTPQGVTYRPFFTAATSLDGSLSSTYFRGANLVVCDNTLTAGLSGADDIIKRRHSVNSIGQIGDVRRALNMIHQEAESFQEELELFCGTEVTDKQWDAFLDAHVSLEGKEKGRGLTMAENHRDALTLLWNHDERVSPWKGTKFGVFQAVNTYEQHVKNVKGMSRDERIMDKAVNGSLARSDRQAMDQLNRVLATV